jgi:hypothetical protein
MKKTIFKLEKEPSGYGRVFSPQCKINVGTTDGIVNLDYDNRHPIGRFSNLEVNGEVVTADVELVSNGVGLGHRFEYAPLGDLKVDENTKEVVEITVYGVAALMPPKD